MAQAAQGARAMMSGWRGECRYTTVFYGIGVREETCLTDSVWDGGGGTTRSLCERCPTARAHTPPVHR